MQYRATATTARLASVFKRDHPRAIDRVIDYFGGEDAAAPSRFTDRATGADSRTA